MIPTSTNFVATVPSGNLKVYPEKAILSPSTLMIGFPKLFCKVRLGKGLQETSIDKKNGTQPIWTQELCFRRNNETQIKIELCDQFVIGPAIIGECFINLDLVFTQRQVSMTCQLMRKGSSVGTIQLRMTWEPDNVLPTFFQAISTNPFAPNSTLPFGSTNNSSNNPFARSNSSTVYSPYGSNVTVLVPQHGGMLIQSPQNLGQQQQQQPTFSLQHGSMPQQMQVSRSMSVQPMNVNSSNNASFGTQIIHPMEEMKEPEEPEDPNLPDDQKCVICLERKKAGAFYRCGHNCCCASCGRKFIGSPCPICRQTVLDFIKVYDT